MNCEQTLNNLPHLVVKEEVETPDAATQGVSRRAFLEHLRTCTACQREYEAVWHTASMLENADEPSPPPELVGNIQRCIRQLHKRQRVAFFANPLAWCLRRLKVEFSPRFVNAVALLFCLITSGFFVKVAFFTSPPEPEFGLTAMEKTRLRNVRISPASWALLKEVSTEKERPDIQPGVVADGSERNPFFTHTTRAASEIWRIGATDTSKETGDSSVANYLQSTASEKLTVFWDGIKTQL